MAENKIFISVIYMLCLLMDFRFVSKYQWEMEYNVGISELSFKTHFTNNEKIKRNILI